MRTRKRNKNSCDQRWFLYMVCPIEQHYYRFTKITQFFICSQIGKKAVTLDCRQPLPFMKKSSDFSNENDVLYLFSGAPNPR